jgi:sec-independent protein translocase protein TatB
MFDFAWSEIGLIAAVALILIGPKDLPVAIRAVTDMVKKARRMASEFQTHVDEMLREANLDEVRTQISQIRNFDVRGMVEGAVDAQDLHQRSAESPNGCRLGRGRDRCGVRCPCDG